MRIESRTTGEHRIRIGLFLLMCIVFAAYFAYDGLWGYPAENLKWSRQNMEGIPPEQQEQVRASPQVTMARIAQVQVGMSLEEVAALLGEPAAVGKPADALSGVDDYWYVGPAAFARLSVFGGRVREIRRAEENRTHSEGDIYWQKVFAVGLSILSLVVLIHFWRINTMRTVLDETGLTVKGRHVPWDRMTGLDTEDYRRKGWLDVVHTAPDGREDTVRLDSYHIEKFDDIVNAICERQGYVSPIVRKDPDEAEQGES